MQRSIGGSRRKHLGNPALRTDGYVPTGNVSTLPPPRNHITEHELILRSGRPREAAGYTTSTGTEAMTTAETPLLAARGGGLKRKMSMIVAAAAGDSFRSPKTSVTCAGPSMPAARNGHRHHRRENA